MRFVFEKKDLLPDATADDVEKYCDAYDLFRHYVGEFKMGKPVLSPLRSEKDPSFAIYVKGGTVLFNDFLLGGGDIIKFIMMRFNLSYREAIAKAVFDSGHGDKFRTDAQMQYKPILRHHQKLEEYQVQIRVKARVWTPKDLKFWKEFGINESTLKKYRVSPISHIFFNRKIVVADTYAYCFTEMKDGTPSYTIYQPFSKTGKWFKSHDASVFYGWSQLPETGDKLIITKSMKDVMTVDSITGIPAVSLQSEKTNPKEHIIKQLKDRFKKIYLIYDNDYENLALDKPNWGRQFGNELATKFDLIQCEIPDNQAKLYSAKDLSDFAKFGGEIRVKMLVNNIEKYEVNS
jgi:hypothetical protein